MVIAQRKSRRELPFTKKQQKNITLDKQAKHWTLEGIG